jgi:hypothetical protein
MTGGAPDRYFLHPELYERDRPLFVKYIPVIRALSSAGWEPITNATANPDGELERFGDFSRGNVLITVRGPDGTALAADITLNLLACGLIVPSGPVELEDVLAGQPLVFERMAEPDRIRFDVSLGAGEVGVYRLVPAPLAPADFDGDGDVDLKDFGHFQVCLTGANMPQDDPDCQDAKLDGDTDVDDADAAVFQGCMSGASIPADPDCAN